MKGSGESRMILRMIPSLTCAWPGYETSYWSLTELWLQGQPFASNFHCWPSLLIFGCEHFRTNMTPSLLSSVPARRTINYIILCSEATPRNSTSSWEQWDILIWQHQVRRCRSNRGNFMHVCIPSLHPPLLFIPPSLLSSFSIASPRPPRPPPFLLPPALPTPPLSQRSMVVLVLAILSTAFWWRKSARSVVWAMETSASTNLSERQQRTETKVPAKGQSKY